MAKARKRPPRNKGDRGKDRVRGSRVKDPVPVDPFRERALELMARGVTVSEIAERIGWKDGSKPDTSRLQRRLGLKPDSSNVKTLKNGVRKTYSPGEPHGFINYERAVELCRGLDLDPVDVKDPVTGESIL